MMKKLKNLNFKIILILFAGALVLSLLAFGSESFLAEEYTSTTSCSDFGTQEKAQYAFNKDIKENGLLFILSGLDLDYDRRACEENPKSSRLILFTFIGLFGALLFVEYKKIGSLKETDFLRKFVMPSLILVYPFTFSVSQLRDRVLPSSTQADVIYLFSFLVAYIPTYLCIKKFEKKAG